MTSFFVQTGNLLNLKLGRNHTSYHLPSCLFSTAVGGDWHQKHSEAFCSCKSISRSKSAFSHLTKPIDGLTLPSYSVIPEAKNELGLFCENDNNLQQNSSYKFDRVMRHRLL